MSRRHCVVIGAGVGGLCAAIHLAARGWRVTVLEQNVHAGGKMSQFTADGFRWDTGPSVITMRHVLEDVFQVAGRRLSDYLTLVPVEPLTRYFWPDGIQLDASNDREVMARRIRSIAPDDVAGYLRYLAYAAGIHRVTGPVFIYDRPPRLASLLRVSPLRWLTADPFRTMSAAINAHVVAPQLRQLLGRFATYVGGSPYLAPATLNVIADVELSGGVSYPRGGVYAIADALVRLARELGVELLMNCAVNAIVLKDGRAAGVALADGAQLDADAVISNVDVAMTYARLLPQAPQIVARLGRLRALEPSCSGFIMLLGVEGVRDRLVHHNVLFSGNYEREFDQIFTARVPPDEPTVYIAITSKADPSHAPPGCENWFVLVNVPALTPEHDWKSLAPKYRDLVLDRIASFGLDVRTSIASEHLLTPSDLERATGAFRGALYGVSANSRWTAFRRPNNRSPDVPGLYFAGGTTHPGGGVPMVALSGKVAAGLVAADFAS
jgi:phytoene desaturase